MCQLVGWFKSNSLATDQIITSLFCRLIKFVRSSCFGKNVESFESSSMSLSDLWRSQTQSLITYSFSRIPLSIQALLADFMCNKVIHNLSCCLCPWEGGMKAYQSDRSHAILIGNGNTIWATMARTTDWKAIGRQPLFSKPRILFTSTLNQDDLFDTIWLLFTAVTKLWTLKANKSVDHCKCWMRYSQRSVPPQINNAPISQRMHWLLNGTRFPCLVICQGYSN